MMKLVAAFTLAVNCILARGCFRIGPPVCSSDGVTYSNQCNFDQANNKQGGVLSVVSQGQCPTQECESPCSSTVAPVCGSDAVTYSNECLFHNANCNGGLYIFWEGECPWWLEPLNNPCEQPCPQTTTLLPVCGSDGVTYDNECLFDNANCKQNGELSIVFNGRCEDRPLSPGCALNITTGQCRAHFRRWAYSQSANDCIRFVYGGCNGNGNNFLTEEACESHCEGPAFACLCVQSQPEDAVCATTGITYDSLCELQCGGQELACEGRCPCRN